MRNFLPLDCERPNYALSSKSSIYHLAEQCSTLEMKLSLSSLESKRVAKQLSRCVLTFSRNQPRQGQRGVEFASGPSLIPQRHKTQVAGGQKSRQLALSGGRSARRPSLKRTPCLFDSEKLVLPLSPIVRK